MAIGTLNESQCKAARVAAVLYLLMAIPAPFGLIYVPGRLIVTGDATATADRIDRIYLSGGAAWVDGFADALEARFETPVELFDPFRKITCDPGKFGIDDMRELVATSAVAVGLALRRAGDR